MQSSVKNTQSHRYFFTHKKNQKHEFDYMYNSIQSLFDDANENQQDLDQGYEVTIENFFKLSEVITIHLKHFGVHSVNFTIDCINKLLKLNAINLLHVKCRIVTYWFSDMYRYIGPYLKDMIIDAVDSSIPQNLVIFVS